MNGNTHICLYSDSLSLAFYSNSKFKPSMHKLRCWNSSFSMFSVFVFGFVGFAQQWSATLWCNRIFPPKRLCVSLVIFPLVMLNAFVLGIPEWKPDSLLHYHLLYFIRACIVYVCCIFFAAAYFCCQIFSIWAAPAINKANTMKKMKRTSAQFTKYVWNKPNSRQS